MKMMTAYRSNLSKLSTAVVASLYLVSCAADKPVDSQLAQQFSSPPDSAKPRVWWHWMNGNVTKEGIAADLAWMNKVGIGGIQNFDANLMTPLIVDKRIVYMSDDWTEMFKFALSEADKYNFEFAIAASPGWSETGGPWVAPQDGMKKLVWTQTSINSSTVKNTVIAPPAQNTGLFQDLDLAPEMFAEAKSEPPHHYYHDIAVLAYPVNAAEAAQPNLPIKVSTSTGEVLDASAIFDGKYATTLAFSSDPKQPFYLEFTYAQRSEFRSASLAMPIPGMFLPANLEPVLLASDNGNHFKQVATFAASGSVQQTLSFPVIQAKYLRIEFRQNPNNAFALPSVPAPGAMPPGDFALKEAGPGNIDFQVMEVAFNASDKVHRFEEKAGFAINENYYQLSQQRDISGLPLQSVVDITDKLDANGHLNWQVPAGEWQVIRLGYSLTGKENHPATPEATGLEVDKYDADAVRRYINRYLDNYRDTIGQEGFGAKGIEAVLNDSIEVGPSNWTPALTAEFKQRRGYDLTPWLPALTGVIIESAQQTDAFLYDFRQTLSELIADNHYGVITEELHKRGLKHYSEALENGRPTLGDGIAMRKHADVPMAAMWSFDAKNSIGPKPQYWSDIREAASVAHIYGQNLVAAESLTSAMAPWAFSPNDLRPMIDMEFALGVNRPIIHTSVHQPLTDKAPGLSLFVFGQYFNRLDTWADYAKPWVTYITRNAFMLQQGRFAADVAYFYGEEAPLTAMYNHAPPTDVPVNHGFDYVNADVIINELSNEGNEIVTPSGARYKVIYLGGSSQYMTLAVLEKLAKLVKNGATIIGQKPLSSPALMDDKNRFAALANELWSGQYGKQVMVSDSVQAGLTNLNISPDFSYQGKADTTLMFVHRTLPDSDIYYYSNRKNQADKVQFSFRITGKQPMHFDAVTGQTQALAYRTQGDQTLIDYPLKGFESGYIVFADKTTASVKEQTVSTELKSIEGEWAVTFQADRGAPAQTQTMALGDWAQSDDQGIKYFSGTATYTKTIKLTKADLSSADNLALELGEVAELAEVIVNGQSAGIVWTAPYRLNIKPYLQVGDNKLEVKVTNLWVNRLIGDKQPDVKQAYTFTTINTYFPNAPLRRSGLMGPVKLLAQ